jgi:hypothetical protein
MFIFAQIESGLTFVAAIQGLFIAVGNDLVAPISIVR